MIKQLIRTAPLVALCVMPIGRAWATAETAPSRPNVLLIVADDLGFSDLGSYGGEIQTPHLDRLATQGMRFTQFYNNAVCTLSRAALLTGVSPRQGPRGLLRPEMITLGEAMRAAGYETTLVGKWHLGDVAPLRPVDRGFEDYYGVLSGCSDYFNPAKPDPAFYGGQRRPFALNQEAVAEFPPGFYTTDAFTDHAVGRIRAAAAQKRPFFINLCYTAPHFPLQAPAEDIARYKGRYRGGYEQLRRQRFERQRELGLLDPVATRLAPADGKTGDYRYDYRVTPWEQLEPEARQREEERMEVYAAMVDHMDEGIGRVLAALDEVGLTKDTVVIFLSDNGGCASQPEAEEMAEYRKYNRGIPAGDPRGYEFVGPGWGWAQNTPFRRHKAWTYEGGICTPMIVRWPRAVAAGAITREPGHVLDLMPTLLELAGGSYSAAAPGRPVLPMEGVSLLPILRGQGAAARAAPLCWELYGNRAVRQGNWKLVWGASERRWELYDLATDRSETTDRAADHPELVASLTATWSEWARHTEVPD